MPRVLLYDNLKSAVLERRGDAIRFHPSLLGFAGHYRYEPRPVAVARGNEKGRVERSIGYIRGAFFAARNFADLDDLNAQADDWCRGLASDRRCPGDRLSRTLRGGERSPGRNKALKSRRNFGMAGFWSACRAEPPGYLINPAAKSVG